MHTTPIASFAVQFEFILSLDGRCVDHCLKCRRIALVFPSNFLCLHCATGIERNGPEKGKRLARLCVDCGRQIARPGQRRCNSCEWKKNGRKWSLLHRPPKKTRLKQTA